VTCFQLAHDKPPESHTFPAPKLEDNGDYHFKIIHITTSFPEII